MVRAEMYKVDNVPFRCEIDLMGPLSLELRVHDLFHVKSAFDPMSGTATYVISQNLKVSSIFLYGIFHLYLVSTTTLND